MKRVLFTVLFIFGTLLCQSQASRISVSELPKQAQLFLKQYYKHRPIESVKKSDSDIPYQVRLAQGTAIKFAENGDWCEVDGDGASLPMTMVPQNVAEYLKKNYPSKRIRHILKGPNSIDVALSGKIGLKFDAKGKPVK